MSEMGSLIRLFAILFPESALRGQERKEDRMYRRYFGISALALAGVLVMADSAMAQRRGGVYVGPSGVGVYSGRGGHYGAGCTGGSYYGSSQNGSSNGAMATNGGALIQLKVPADATVTFDGNPTQQTGEIRQFLTPPLEANKNFSYEVHVKGQNMD